MSERSAQGGDFSAQFGGYGSGDNRTPTSRRRSRRRTTVSNKDRASAAAAMMKDTAKATGKRGFAKYLKDMIRARLPKPVETTSDSIQIFGDIIRETVGKFAHKRDRALRKQGKPVDPKTARKASKFRMRHQGKSFKDQDIENQELQDKK